MNPVSRLGQEWFGNVRGDVLAGLVVALTLIPEAIAFSIIAGVDPKVGLYASFCIAVVIDVTGARFWDLSAVGALDKVVMKFRREGAQVDIIGMDTASTTLVDRLGIHDKPDAGRLMGH